VQIQGPPNAQQAQQYQMKISSIVPEGTIVKEGDIVAELDRSGLASRLTEVSLALQKAEAQYSQAQLDSTLALSQAREEIRTFEYALEERRLAKEQATYEAPTIRRQAEIDYEKAQRTLAQAKENYKTKTQQSIAKMREVGSDVERQRNQLGIVQSVMQGFTIRAPGAGMVIYAKEWNGRKKQVGSQVTPWEPTVATLPDLTEMESVTYVNEIDVRKIAVGQPVRLSLDADPGKQLVGKVTGVANVGEQRPNADAKVFEVVVSVEGRDTTLLPGMTTSNAVETAVIPDALSIPLEAMAVVDSIPIVYTRSGGRIVRQEIETGAMNDNEIVVRRGLASGDRVLLVAPPNAAELPLVRLEGGRAPSPDSLGGDTARPAVRTATSGASR
jgi:RND family efflux transporter MFP subunit